MPTRTKNKGGRPATGRFRSMKFGLELTNDEREYLSRKVYSLRSHGENVSQNGFIISRAFPPQWVMELEQLRHEQRGISAKKLWVPK